jgi:hypothetical protein
MATKWPETVPVLEADDICAFDDVETSEQKTLEGWLDLLFSDWQLRYDARLAILRAAHRRSTLAYIELEKVSADEVAMAFNRGMERLGYTEIIDA